MESRNQEFDRPPFQAITPYMSVNWPEGIVCFHGARQASWGNARNSTPRDVCEYALDVDSIVMEERWSSTQGEAAHLVAVIVIRVHGDRPAVYEIEIPCNSTNRKEFHNDVGIIVKKMVFELVRMKESRTGALYDNAVPYTDADAQIAPAYDPELEAEAFELTSWDVPYNESDAPISSLVEDGLLGCGVQPRKPNPLEQPIISVPIEIYEEEFGEEQEIAQKHESHTETKPAYGEPNDELDENDEDDGIEAEIARMVEQSIRETQEKKKKHAAKCPACGSYNLDYCYKAGKPLSAGKAAVGAVIAGPVGAVIGAAMGTAPKKTGDYVCLDCGQVFLTWRPILRDL